MATAVVGAACACVTSVCLRAHCGWRACVPRACNACVRTYDVRARRRGLKYRTIVLPATLASVLTSRHHCGYIVISMFLRVDRTSRGRVSPNDRGQR